MEIIWARRLCALMLWLEVSDQVCMCPHVANVGLGRAGKKCASFAEVLPDLEVSCNIGSVLLCGDVCLVEGAAAIDRLLVLGLDQATEKHCIGILLQVHE